MFPVVKSYCVILARNLPYYETLLLNLITKILLLKYCDCKTFLSQKVLSIASDNKNINNEIFDKTFVALFKNMVCR